MRLFYAIGLTEQIRSSLEHVAYQLEKQAHQGNFTRSELYHITLAFLGEVPSPRKAIQALESVKGEPFLVSIGGLGKFRRQGGDLYWAGVRVSPGLEQVYCQLCGRLKQLGFSLEDRPFRPHITLGREVVLPPGTAGVALPEQEMMVSRISLMKSERLKGNLVYTEIAGKELP